MSAADAATKDMQEGPLKDIAQVAEGMVYLFGFVLVLLFLAMCFKIVRGCWQAANRRPSVIIDNSTAVQYQRSVDSASVASSFVVCSPNPQQQHLFSQISTSAVAPLIASEQSNRIYPQLGDINGQQQPSKYHEVV